jgi:hypothetical protein
MSNWDLKKDDELDLDEVIRTIKYVLVKLTAKDFVIILLMLMMFLLYVVNNNDIAACNAYYQNILRNTTRLTTSLW